MQLKSWATPGPRVSIAFSTSQTVLLQLYIVPIIPGHPAMCIHVKVSVYLLQILTVLLEVSGSLAQSYKWHQTYVKIETNDIDVCFLSL